jgi:hypothetical protein
MLLKQKRRRAFEAWRTDCYLWYRIVEVTFQTCPLLQQAGGEGMGGAKTACLREPMFAVGFARSYPLLVAAEGFFRTVSV